MDRPILLPLIVAGLVSLGAAGCQPVEKTQPRIEPPPVVLPDSVQLLSPDQAEKLITESSSIRIVDMRTEGEAQADGRIAGAQIYDYLHGESVFEKLAELDRQRPCLIYCAIGGRAKLTAERMSQMGFQRLAVLDGGINAWISAGKPVQK